MANCFCKVWLNLIILFQSGILLSNLGEGPLPPKQKWSAALWFYLSPEFRISCCQVCITCQITDGAWHISPPLVSDPRVAIPRPPKWTPMSAHMRGARAHSLSYTSCRGSEKKWTAHILRRLPILLSILVQSYSYCCTRRQRKSPYYLKLILGKNSTC